MKGRSEFTQAEIDELRTLVREKAGSSASRQKQIRSQMRERGFYATDFGYQGHGFREKDLDHLLEKGLVTISDAEDEDLGWWGRLKRAIRRWWA